MLPVNSTTIQTSNIIFKITISNSSISTILSIITMKEYSTTTILSKVINKVTIILNNTMTTYPNHSTTISTTENTTNIRDDFPSSFITSKVRITYSTIVTTPVNSTTTTISNVILENRISNSTIKCTTIPINSTTI